MHDITKTTRLDAARTIWQHWQSGQVLAALPAESRPGNLDEGYAIQAYLPQVSGRAVKGWKLAATNPTGQAHIGVSAPIAGRLLGDQVLRPGAEVTLGANQMRVAEAEIGLRLGANLPARETPYTIAEVQDAVTSVHPCIEFPDSRFAEFASAGAPQLAADCACAQWFVAGPAHKPSEFDLEDCEVALKVNGEVAVQGHSTDVMGSPWHALVWLANAHRATGGLQAEQIITTGVCGHPATIKTGDLVRVELSATAHVEARVA